MNSSIRMLAMLAGCLLMSFANAGTNGKYVMQGGAYSINVEFAADGLRVVEPNKTSLYTPSGAGAYQFTNPTNGITYGIRVLDANTIEAFKPGSTQPGTVLKLAAASAPQVDEDSPAYEKYMTVAEKYTNLTESDPNSLQVWTACAAAAFAWAHMPKQEAEQFSRTSADMLKTILVDAGSTPCADAIPASAW